MVEPGASVSRAAFRRRGAAATAVRQAVPVPLALALVLAAAGLPARAQPAPDPCRDGAVGTITGRVEARDGTLLGGARVRVQTCLGGAVVTDAGGRFSLPVPAGEHVVTAAAAGYYNGCAAPVDGADCGRVTAGRGGLVVTLDPLPHDDDPFYVFQSPETCETCHAAIYEQWSRSTKARTNRNGWVAGLYNGTDATMGPGPPPDPNRPPFFGFLARHNVDAANPTRNGECANCHQPEYVGPDPTNTNFNRFADAQHRGVSCAFCHKIVDVDVSAAGIGRPNLVGGDGHGGDGLPPKTRMLRSPGEPGVFFGPLDDVTFHTPTMRASYAAILGSSRLCAACHEDNTDPRDPNGDFRGTYDGPASQLTYSEWAASPYAQEGVECQDCHMPPVEADRLCDVADIRRDASQIRSHAFEGTTPEFLRRAVILRASAVPVRDALRVTVEITNSGAGHHVPTGVTLRNMILVVVARDREGNPLPQLEGPVVPNWGGAGDPAAGNFAGLPGKGYARVLVDEFLAENVLFTEAVNAFDNRIPALATDTTEYLFALPKRWEKQDVRVESVLYYRRAFKPIADQRRWNVPLGGNAHGTRGDGADYDENFVMAAVTNQLTCRGKLRKLRARPGPGAEGLVLSAVLKMPRGSSLDPAADGVEVMLGDRDRPNALVQEELRQFSIGADTTLAASGEPGAVVQELRLTPKGRRALRLEADLAGLDPEVLATTKLVLGLDSGELCFRSALRCRTKRGVLKCR